MADGSYIKLHRKITEWGWYSDINTKVLFLHILLKANWKAKEWQGVKVERGQLISSYSNLASETGLSVSEIRTALKHLISTGEVAHQPFNKFGLFTVIKYDMYQSVGSQDSSQNTVSSQPIDNLLATTKEVKKEKKEKNEKNIYTPQFEEFWSMYPRKTEKARCFSCYRARLKDGYTDIQLLDAAKNYLEQCKKNDTEERFIKHGATFLSASKPFEEFIEKQVVEIPRKESPQEQDESPEDFGWNE